VPNLWVSVAKCIQAGSVRGFQVQVSDNWILNPNEFQGTSIKYLSKAIHQDKGDADVKMRLDGQGSDLEIKVDAEFTPKQGGQKAYASLLSPFGFTAIASSGDCKSDEDVGSYQLIITLSQR
jgi:hypothetical protein